MILFLGFLLFIIAIYLWAYIDTLKCHNKRLADIISNMKPEQFEESYATYYSYLFIKCRKSYYDYRLSFAELSRMYISLPSSPDKKLFGHPSDVESYFKSIGFLHDYSIDGTMNHISLDKVKQLEKFIKINKRTLADDLSRVQ